MFDKTLAIVVEIEYRVTRSAPKDFILIASVLPHSCFSMEQGRRRSFEKVKREEKKRKEKEGRIDKKLTTQRPSPVKVREVFTVGGYENTGTKESLRPDRWSTY